MLISHRDLTSKFVIKKVFADKTDLHEHVGLYFDKKSDTIELFDNDVKMETVNILACITEYCIHDKKIITDFIELIMPNLVSILKSESENIRLNNKFDIMFDLDEETILYWKMKYEG